MHNKICFISIQFDTEVVRLLDSDILTIVLGNMNKNFKSINQLQNILGNSISKAWPGVHDFIELEYAWHFAK